MGYAERPRHDADLVAPVRTVNAAGQGPFAIVVDHASNRIPARYANLGLPPSELVRHIAWDPGALGVSLRLSDLLDAPVVHSTVSRLVIDCNRELHVNDLIPEISEYTVIPGNAAVTDQDRAERIALAYLPFHAAIDALLDPAHAGSHAATALSRDASTASRPPVPLEVTTAANACVPLGSAAATVDMRAPGDDACTCRTSADPTSARATLDRLAAATIQPSTANTASATASVSSTTMRRPPGRRATLREERNDATDDEARVRATSMRARAGSARTASSPTASAMNPGASRASASAPPVFSS